MIQIFTILISVGPIAFAQVAHLPSNLSFACACRYGMTDAKLTCRDVRGNKLIDGVRVYDRQWFVEYDELMIIAMMRGQGFDLGPRVTYKSERPSFYFYRRGCDPSGV